MMTVAKHRHELVPSPDTFLLINYKVGGIGSNSCGPKLGEKYMFRDSEFDFRFEIK